MRRRRHAPRADRARPPASRAARAVGRGALAVGLVGTLFAAPTFDSGAEVEASGASSDIIAIVLEGTGHGHGRGLSQWGAYGHAVDHGWTSTQILDHYYGGTSSGSTSTGERIRVRLTTYDGQGTTGVISHGAGVQWNGQTAPAMRAVEVSRGVFDIEQANTVACPSSSSVSVPEFDVAFGSSNNDAVRQIQAFLDRFHDDSIVVDGLWGAQTSGALSSWQASEGLAVDGANWSSDDWARALQIIGAAGGSVSWTKIGQHTQSPGSPVRFTTAGGDGQSTLRGDVLGVCSTSGRVTHYRGAIEVVDSANGNRVVNDVPVEQYVRGVVPKEISASWAFAGDGAGAQAVEAQAVAARSYGISESRSGDSYEYRDSDTRFATTCDTTSCQVYAGSATRSSATGNATRVEQDATDTAILATAGVVRRWPNGDIVRTEFSASNGPRTAGGAFPPVDDIGDDTAPNPNHRWTRILDADDFAAAHGLGQITSVEMVEAASSTYQQFDGIWFNDVLITGSAGQYREDSWDFRNAYDLRSPGFTVRAITRSSSDTEMAFIGDSVGNSIAHSGSSELRRLTDGTFPTQIIDVVDGRCTTKSACPGATGVEVADSLPTGLDLVVVELGYNDTVSNFASDIDAMMTALTARGVQQVAWINMADIRVSGGNSVYGPANAALDDARGRWSNLIVLDWNAASDNAERERWFSDGVHLTTTGQAEFALWVRRQLLELAPSHYLVPPKRIELPVVGSALRAPDGAELAVPIDAAAVAVNVTVVRPADRGFVTVWPCTDELPEISNLNYVAGDIRANSIIAPVSPDGTICLYSFAGTEIIVDVAGWFAGGSGGSYLGLEPERRVDTRIDLGGTRVQPATPLRLPIHGTEVTTIDGTTTALGTDVSAVALNVAAIRPDDRGFVTLWPCDLARPEASNVNYVGGQTVANGVLAPVGADGAVCLYSFAPTDVIVDLMGVISGADGEQPFQHAAPTRLIDTRTTGDRVAAGATLEVPIVGRVLDDPLGSDTGLTVPADATAVAVNVTMVRPDGRGFATIWPCTDPVPTASNVNYVAGENVANSAIAPIGPDGSICVYTFADSHVIVDVSGWFSDSGDYVAAVPDRLVDTRFAVGPIPA